MAAWYWDSSALLKRYIVEKGSAWVRGMTGPAAGHDLYTVSLTGPEVSATLARLVRGRHLTRTAATRADAGFRRDWDNLFEIVVIDRQLATVSMDVARRHALRGADAIHLAANRERRPARFRGR